MRGESMTIVIKVNNPDNSNNTFSSLTADAPIGATILSVVDSTRLSVNDYIIVGKEGIETAEIVKITAISNDVTIVTTALANGHNSGEDIRKTRFNKMEIYRSLTESGAQTLLATIDIQVENSQKNTIYYDTLGDSTMWYQVVFFNNVSIERVYGTIFKGGVHEYATLTDFRMQTGLSTDDISDDKVKYYLNEAYIHIRDDGYLWFRGDILNNTTTPAGQTRWYFQKKFIADGDLNNIVDKDDLTVWEYDSYDQVDITAQVSSLNVLSGYITLNTGYPTTNRSVKADFYIAKRPIEEIQTHLRDAAINNAAWLIMREMSLRITKKGVNSYGIDGINVSKSKDELTKSMDEYLKKYEYHLSLIKPSYVKSTKIGGFEYPTTMQRFRGWY
jgi:hypothetical protein